MADTQYEEETPSGWVEAVAASWNVAQHDDTVVVSGDCPTCGHATSSTFARVTAGKGLTRKIDVIIFCQCATAHPGTPEGKAGCGRQGRFQVEVE